MVAKAKHSRHLRMCRVRTRSKRAASSQNLTRKTSHMLNVPYNFLNGFELISKMTPGTSKSAEIRRSAEKSHAWVVPQWQLLTERETGAKRGWEKEREGEGRERRRERGLQKFTSLTTLWEWIQAWMLAFSLRNKDWICACILAEKCNWPIRSDTHKGFWRQEKVKKRMH